MMRAEVVGRLGWLSEEEFLDLLGASNLIPGPNSTEMAIHIGLRRCGWKGLVAAGLCFILPAVLLVSGCAWVYVRYGQLPVTQSAFYLLKPVIVAVIVHAMVGLARSALKSWPLRLLALCTLTLSAFGVSELPLLLGCGALAAVRARPSLRTLLLLLLPAVGWAAFPRSLDSPRIPFGNLPLFLFFLKVGSVLYGSGYVLLAFLRTTLVDQWGWLTLPTLLDATAVGQLTPGPVFTTATFIGYILGGPQSACLATVGIFLPSFLLVALSGPLVPRLRSHAGAFLDGVNAAALALLILVSWQMGRSALVDLPTVTLASVSFYLLSRRKRV